MNTLEIAQKETWKDIKGYEGIYQVSDLGNIRRILKKRYRILKPVFSRRKYAQITLCKSNVGITKDIHRLVASAFLGESELTVNHKNKNLKDNSLANLEYVSYRDNIIHSQLCKNKSSKYTGVNKKNGKWQARITINKKREYLGVFDTEEEASIAYNKRLSEINEVSNYVIIP